MTPSTPTPDYGLKKVTDLLLPEILDPLLAGTIFFGKIHHALCTGSTNSDAMRAAAAGASEGSVFLAEEQMAGRGRGGHSWHSQKFEGIYCSVVLRPQTSPAEALGLSLMAGLAVQAAVKEVTGLQADLRWPNDLLLCGKKICGILAEMNAESARVRYAVVGIGINVNQTGFPEDLVEAATSLLLESTASAPMPRINLAAALLQSLDREYRRMLPFKELIRRFEQNSSFARGKRVYVNENGGYKGVTCGLNENGFLRVKTADGVRIVLSGGVRPLD